jgi:uncharacterized protein YraI
MKRLILVAIALIILLALPAIAQAGGPVTAPTLVEVVRNSNLRLGPSTAFRIVDIAVQGERLNVYGCNIDCTWYFIGATIHYDVWIAAFLTRPVAPATGPGTLPRYETWRAPLAVPVAPVVPAPPVVPISPLVPVPGVGAAVVTQATTLYAGPGFNYPQRGVVSQGQQLIIDGRNTAGTWYVLASGDWIQADRVANVPPNLPLAWEPPPPEQPQPVAPVQPVSPLVP